MLLFSLLQIQAPGPQGAGALQAAGAHHGGRPHIPLRGGGDGRRAAGSAATAAAAAAIAAATAAATGPSNEAEVGEPVPSGQAAPPPLQEEEKEGEGEGTTLSLK